MSHLLPLEAYAATVDRSAALLSSCARRAGRDAPVPTCPEWSVRDLLVHQGVVHRWAAAVVGGHCGLDGAIDESEVISTVAASALPTWVESGAATLCEALQSAAPDVEVPVFLANAPRPREFWARRQAHETTVHAVDTLAAELGRTPLAAEAVDALEIASDFAADGVDELLRGFFSRGHRSRLFAGTPFRIAVIPSDHTSRWAVMVDEAGLRVGDDDASGSDVAFTGTSAQLYLGLWNRGDEITATGDSLLLDRWHDKQRVIWE